MQKGLIVTGDVLNDEVHAHLQYKYVYTVNMPLYINIGRILTAYPKKKETTLFKYFKKRNKFQHISLKMKTVHSTQNAYIYLQVDRALKSIRYRHLHCIVKISNLKYSNIKNTFRKANRKKKWVIIIWKFYVVGYKTVPLLKTTQSRERKKTVCVTAWEVGSLSADQVSHLLLNLRVQHSVQRVRLEPIWVSCINSTPLRPTSDRFQYYPVIYAQFFPSGFRTGVLYISHLLLCKLSTCCFKSNAYLPHISPFALRKTW
jgi:hypothetical protein